MDPACLPPTAAALVSAPSAVVAHPTGVDVAYARAYGMTSSGIRPTIVGVPCQPGLALQSVTDVVSSRTRVHSHTPIPLSDVGQRDLPRLTYDLSVPTASTLSGNIDVIDIACTHGPSSADVPRPSGVLGGIRGYTAYTNLPGGWWRGSVVERRSLAGELSLSCARPAADG